MLKAIWIASIALSVISLMIMLVLILRRIVLERRQQLRNEHRSSVQRALIEFSETRDGDALRQMMSTVPPAISLEASFELLGLLRGEEHARIIRVLSDTGLAEQAIGLLKSGNKVERIHAAEMLGGFANVAGAAALLTAFEEEPSDDVRIAIAIALSQLGRLLPLQQVLGRIGRAGKESGRIAELFAQWPGDRLAELREFVGHEAEPPFARAAAIEALGNSGDPALLSFFRPLANDASAEVATAALRALGRIGHPGATDVVIEAMADAQRGDLRANAAEAAGRIGAADFARPLAALLSDDIWTVRYAAARALRLIPGGADVLMQTALGTASRSQRMASLVLSEGEVRC